MSTTRGILMILTLAVPSAVFGDINATITLNSGQILDLDTGSVVTSGGDVLYNAQGITPQGKATALSLGEIPFSVPSPGYIQSFSSHLVSAPIPNSMLVANDVVIWKTNGGNYAKLVVTANTGTSITFQYLTYGATASGGGSGPNITLVQNNYSYLVPGAPNYGIAPGALFIVKGTGLAAASAQAVLWDLSKGPIPQSAPDSNGTSITVVVNGTSVHPGIYYYTATQVAAVLPSNTPVGNGTISVTYNGQTSQTASIAVVTSAMGFDTLYGIGSGQAVATDNATGALISYAASAKPQQVVVLWGSGDGADTTNDDLSYPAKQDQLSYISALYIGGVSAKILYQGRSQFPGVDQIDVVIPDGVSGCYVGVTAVSGTGGSAVVSNSVSMPIEPNGGECSDPGLGVSGSALASFSSMTGVKTGSLTISQQTIVSGTPPVTIINPAGGGLFQVSQGGQFGAGYSAASPGNCYYIVQPVSAGPFPAIQPLDAGTIVLTGGSPSPITMTNPSTGQYSAVFASGYTLAGGTSFTFNNGAGGKDVGSFNATLVVPSPPLTWTNMNSITSVTRSQGVKINWSGGDPNSFVTIYGQSISGGVTVSFICIAPQPALTFTVPPYVTLALPAGPGGLYVSNFSTPVSFTAPGLDYGSLTYSETSATIGVKFN